MGHVPRLAKPGCDKGRLRSRRLATRHDNGATFNFTLTQACVHGRRLVERECRDVELKVVALGERHQLHELGNGSPVARRMNRFNPTDAQVAPGCGSARAARRPARTRSR